MKMIGSSSRSTSDHEQTENARINPAASSSPRSREADEPVCYCNGWHRGERTLQERVGSPETLASAGSRILRPFMTEQHRTFFRQLPFLVTGCIDAEGWPWASFLVGTPGFAWSPNPRQLRVDRIPFAADPLAEALTPGSPIAFLGIELPTRRRNRLNGHVACIDRQGFLVTVDQSFGNCARYIQRRDWTSSEAAPTHLQATTFVGLDDREARALISRCDTFFVATYASPGPTNAQADMDVSHRGGWPGFVRTDTDGVLTIPDFAGNKYFNTLGNIFINPRAGMVIPDFERGDILLVTGSAWLDGQDVPPGSTPSAAVERYWHMKPARGVWLRGALPMRFVLSDRPPQTAGA